MAEDMPTAGTAAIGSVMARLPYCRRAARP